MNGAAMGITEEKVGVYAGKSVLAGGKFGAV